MRADGGAWWRRVGLWKASVARLVLYEMPTIAYEGGEADSAIERALSANGSDAQSLRVEYQIAVRHYIKKMFLQKKSEVCIFFG